MFNPGSIAANAFGDYLAEVYIQYFAGRHEGYASYIGGAARLVMERFGNSDALYHDAEHTMMVTLVGQQILRGQLLKHALQPEDWLHFTLALLIHDIGYTRDACSGDRDGAFVCNLDGDLVSPPRGASDAFLAPYHVERGIIYARERFGGSGFIDEERIVRAIAFTRFPVPNEEEYQETESEAALVRAADLIGQMGDPFYYRKINRLFHEFEEIGMTRQLGYETPMDLVEKYPDFFWSRVQPYIGPAIRHLEQTVEGKQWVANLYNHIFQSAERASCLGPFAGPDAAKTDKRYP